MSEPGLLLWASRFKTDIYNKDLYLGRFGFGAWYPLNGCIDDVRIYNRALSNSEVQTLYNE